MAWSLLVPKCLEALGYTLLGPGLVKGKGRARPDYPHKKPAGKQAQKTTSVILSAWSLFFPYCISVCEVQEQTMVKSFLKHSSILFISTWGSWRGPGNREEASSTCLNILVLLKMPLGLASGDKKKHGAKSSVSEQ